MVDMILIGDVMEQLATLPDESVHCVVTSPPYWGLRDYAQCQCIDEDRVPDPDCETCKGTGKEDHYDYQIGLEETPQEFISKMVKVFAEVRRVLRSDGVCWVNLGDSYAGGGRGSGSAKQQSNRGTEILPKSKVLDGLKSKDLMGMPWRVALALQADGWWMRKDVIEEVEFYCPCGCGYIMEERIWRWSQDRDLIWKKENPMPESTKDRPTTAHEYIFLLTKSAQYFYDAEAIKTDGRPSPKMPDGRDTGSGGHGSVHRKGREQGAKVKPVDLGLKQDQLGKANYTGFNGRYVPRSKANRRSVWTIPTQPFAGAHFATFPEELVRLCVLAGTSEKGCCDKCGAPYERVYEKTGHVNKREAAHVPGNASSKQDSTGWAPTSEATDDWQPTCECGAGIEPCVVMDPFLGSGTVGLVAKLLKRNWIGIELNPKYADIARIRIEHQKRFTPNKRTDKNQIAMEL